MISWSSAGHQLVNSWSSVGHQLVINCSSAVHHLLISCSSVVDQLVISWSSAGHQLVNSCSSAAHQLLISWSSAAHQLLISWSSARKRTSACVPSSGCHFGTQANPHRKWASAARIVLLAPRASACYVCISFLHRPLPPAKPACPSRLARLRLLHLHVLFLSVCLASAC